MKTRLINIGIVLALLLVMAVPVLAASVSHSNSTTHRFNPDDAGGQWDGSGWWTFQSVDGRNHLYYGYVAIQFGGSGATVDDGADGDFTTVTPISLTDPSGLGFREHTFAEYTGTGYKVSQFTYSNDTADGDNWVILELTIENTSGSTLTSGRVMLHTDWDVDEHTGDNSDFDPTRNMIYQFDDNSPDDFWAAGTSLLNQTHHGYGTIYWSAANQGDTFRDGQFTAPSNTTEPVTEGDYVIWNMAALPDIAPGGSETVAFAMCASHSTVDADDALSKLQGCIDRVASDLSITKTADPDPVEPGSPLTYTLTFSHAGSVAATGVVITDVMPITVTNLSFVSSGAAITPTGGISYTWQVEDLSPGEGGVITITGVVSPGLAAGLTFTNTATITTTAVERDTVNNSDFATVSVALVAPEVYLYLPLILRSPAPDLPDLVGSFSLSPDKLDFGAGEPVQITVVITNQSTTMTTSPFWVDFFINPSSPPTAASMIWSDYCGTTPCYGIAWYVPTILAPGQSVTLTSTPDSYANGYTIWPGSFASGTTDLYLYVDSWNPGVVTGAVAESDEANNRAELHGLVVTGANAAQDNLPRADELPPRPVRLGK